MGHSREQVAKKLQMLIDKEYGGNVAKAGRVFDLTRQQVTAVLICRTKPTDAILEAMGYRRIAAVETYEKKPSAKPKAKKTRTKASE